MRAIISGIADLLELDPDKLSRGTAIEVDDRFVGDGYGIPTDASREAHGARGADRSDLPRSHLYREGHGGLIAYVRQQRFKDNQTVLFWHTGGQVGLFA